jgi:hypothetical protein
LRPGQVGRSARIAAAAKRADAPKRHVSLASRMRTAARRCFSRASNSRRTAKRGSARHTRSGRRSPPRHIDCFRRLSSSSRSR